MERIKLHFIEHSASEERVQFSKKNFVDEQKKNC